VASNNKHFFLFFWVFRVTLSKRSRLQIAGMLFSIIRQLGSHPPELQSSWLLMKLKRLNYTTTLPILFMTKPPMAH
jgi:hypothetical protein